MLRIASVNQDRGIGPEKKKGASVHLLAMRTAFAELGAEVINLDEPNPARLTEKLEAASRDRGLSLIYERYSIGRSGAGQFAAVHNVPYVVEVNAPLAEEQRQWRQTEETPQDRAADQLIFRAADGVIAVSKAVASYCVDRGAASSRVRVVPNGVDTSVFKPTPEKLAEQRQFSADRDVVIGFHGRLRPWHGFSRLVEACATLIEEQARFRLLVVGEGDFEKELARGLPRDVWEVVGWQPYPQIADYVAQFDVVPLCYGPETACYFSPLKLMEAMACGAVPVAPAIGDLPNAVLHRTNGLLYAPGDVDALTKALRRLITEPALRNRLSRAAIQTAAENSWQNVARIVLAFSRPAAYEVEGIAR